MEQEARQKNGPGLAGLLAGIAAVLLLAVTLRNAPVRAASALAPAELDVPRPVSGAQAAAETSGNIVVPFGRSVGIKLFSDGVLVVGLSPVDTEQGAQYPGRDCGLKAGDIITHVDGDEVDTIEQIQDAVSEHGGSPLAIQAMRGQKQVQLTAAPVENNQGVFQLGVWLRDSMAGIGTMTFYDPASGVFAALGHGINDVDTAQLMPLESGSIMKATVSEVKKGVSGHPGELHGQFDLQQDLGALYANTERGIFGVLSDPAAAQGAEAVEIATREQIQVGDAVILSNIRGDEVEQFDIQITHVSSADNNGRSLMVQITDPELLEATGGIVQGMSGSPILQNGRLVGAVTHVLVNDPTRGYGILASDMLRQAVS